MSSHLASKEERFADRMRARRGVTTLSVGQRLRRDFTNTWKEEPGPAMRAREIVATLPSETDAADRARLRDGLTYFLSVLLMAGGPCPSMARYEDEAHEILIRWQRLSAFVAAPVVCRAGGFGDWRLFYEERKTLGGGYVAVETFSDPWGRKVRETGKESGAALGEAAEATARHLYERALEIRRG